MNIFKWFKDKREFSKLEKSINEERTKINEEMFKKKSGNVK